MVERGNHKETIKHLELSGNENPPNKKFQDTATEVPREKKVYPQYLYQKRRKIKN